MLIGVDETGYFRDKKGEKLGIVTLVSITDSTWSKFSDFMDKLYPEGWKHVKGNTIDNKSREKVLKYLGKHPEIKYTSILFDISAGSDESITKHQDASLDKMMQNLEDMKHQLYESYIKDVTLLRNQIRKLKLGDYAKFVMITELFIEWQRFFMFDYISTHHNNDSWVLHHVIDMQTKPEKFKRLVRSMMILTASHLNPNYGIYTPKEWISGHPFINRHTYNRDPNLHDAGKFYENFKIGNEQNDPVLFLPDIIGNSIYLSIMRRKETQWLKYLKRIRSNRSLTLLQGGNKDRYYIISGFDQSKKKFEVNPILKDHYRLMREI